MGAMDTPTTLRISRPDDLLAVLPYRLGFRPRNSVVLLGLRGPRGRLGLVSRADLADVGDPATGTGLLRDIADLMHEDGARDVFVALYCDLPRDALAADPVVARALTHLRDVTGWADPPGPWVVGDRTYGLWGTAQECGPATGEVADLERGEVAATMVLHGLTVAADREHLGVPRTGDVQRRRHASRAAREARRDVAVVRARCGGGAPVPGAVFGLSDAVPAADQGEMEVWREGELRRWSALVAHARRGAALPADELGRLSAGLDDELVRDGVLCSVVGPPAAHLPGRDPVGGTLDLVMLAGAPEPDPVRVGPAEHVLRALAACVPRRAGAQALAVLAFLAWWQGDGARADVLAAQALRAVPGTRLAEIVGKLLAARLAPGWVQGAGNAPASGPPIR